MNRIVLALAIILLIALGATAQTTNGLSPAEIQGRQLVQEILQEMPATNFTQQGVLKIEDSNRKAIGAGITFLTIITNENWETDYFVNSTADNTNKYIRIHLVIIHQNSQPNKYLLAQDAENVNDDSLVLTIPKPLSETQIMSPFAGSDFWIADLGLEFFHWPGQKVLKHETRRTRACTVLESTNPDPAPGAYSRVVSWIDDESLAIIWAVAYDANGKLLKEFDPKKVKKINGQWELEEMEIQNVQTHSRTWIKFDLK